MQIYPSYLLYTFVFIFFKCNTNGKAPASYNRFKTSNSFSYFIAGLLFYFNIMSTNLFVALNKMHAAITPTTISVGYNDSHTLKHNSEKLNLVSKTPVIIILTFIIAIIPGINTSFLTSFLTTFSSLIFFVIILANGI